MRLARPPGPVPQEIEREGGAARALETGSIQQAVAKVRTARSQHRAPEGPLCRHERLPDLAETRPPFWRCRGSRLFKRRNGAHADAQAEPFERLRDKSDLYRKKHGEAEGVPRLSRAACRLQCAVEFRACSKRAASKPSKETAATSRNDSRNRARSLLASAPPTRSMSARRKPPPRR